MLTIDGFALDPQNGHVMLQIVDEKGQSAPTDRVQM